MINIVQKCSPSAIVAFAVDKDRSIGVAVFADLLTIRAVTYASDFPALRLFLLVVSLRNRVSCRLLEGGGGRCLVHFGAAMNSRMRFKVRLRSSRPLRKSPINRQSPTALRPNVDSAMS